MTKLTDEAIELINLIDRCDAVYYDEDKQLIPDDEYDLKKRRLLQLTEKFKGEIPTLSRVGPPFSKDKHRLIVSHGNMMVGSLNDAMNPSEFVAWWPGVPVVASLKVDGLTLVATYDDGRLITAATRGNGEEGEDVTANAVKVAYLPTMLPIPWSGRVRGEVYLPVSTLKAINAELAEEEEDEFANPRNAASGILRSDDGQFADRLEFVAHGYLRDRELIVGHTEIGTFNFLGNTLGLKTPGPALLATLDEALGYHAEITKSRAGLDFWIDGVVFTVNNTTKARAMGVSNKRPKGSIAFKFKAERATTTLASVEWTVKHSGKLTPRGDLLAVKIGGSTVRSVSLFNIEEIRRLGVQIGDEVILQKAGDIIPNLVGVAAEAPGERRKIIEAPNTCPACERPVNQLTTTSGKLTVDIYCINSKCPARVVGLIERFTRSLEIKWIGKELRKALAYEKLVQSPADLYRLSFADLADLKVNGKRLGNSKANSVLREIEAKQNLTIDQFLGSIGIKHLGKRRVEIMRSNWDNSAAEGGLTGGDLDTLHWWLNILPAAANNNALDLFGSATGTPGMIKTIAKEIYEKITLIEALEKVITIIPPVRLSIEPKTNGPLTGRVICLTGKFDQPKAHYHGLIEQKGGTAAKDFGNSVTDLVSADTGKLSSKLKAAKAKGVNVMSVDELENLLT